MSIGESELEQAAARAKAQKEVEQACAEGHDCVALESERAEAERRASELAKARALEEGFSEAPQPDGEDAEEVEVEANDLQRASETVQKLLIENTELKQENARLGTELNDALAEIHRLEQKHGV